VKVLGTGLANGNSWINALPGDSLQSAINNSAVGDEVWVACGTYRTTTTSNRNLSFRMRNGVIIYGGFEGTETALSQRTLSCGSCSVLSGEIGVSGISDNSYHVVSNPIGINTTAIIDGFVVQDANDNRAATLTNGLGGGLYNNGSNPGNSCNPTIRNCLIRNNYAQFGAGIFNSGHTGGNSNPVISNCVITNNTAYQGGGGIDNFGLNGTSSPVISNTIVYANTAIFRAGGMYCWGGSNGNANPVVTNCVFANNTAVDGGGVVSDRLNSGAGSSGNSNPNFVNCIFWGNTASGTGPQFFNLGGAAFIATYSDIDLTGQFSPHIISGIGTGNLNVNPQFVNSLNAIGIDNCWLTNDDGLMLQSISPIINAGTLSGAPLVDILGRLRIGNPEPGAYEYVISLLNLKVFIEGYYTNGAMTAVVDPINYPNLCDTITVELHDTTSPYNVVETATSTIDINGNGVFTFSPAISGNSYYIVVKTRNGVETWSKLPVTFGAVTNFDFTQ